jgi:hypothetical protein
MDTADLGSDERRTGRLDSVWIRGALATAGAVVVNVGIVLLARTAGVAPGFQALTVPPVAFLSAVGAIGALVVYLVVRRRSKNPASTFRRVAIAALLVSFVPDLGLLVADDAATPLGVALLMAMHVTVAAICIQIGRAHV